MGVAKKGKTVALLCLFATRFVLLFLDGECNDDNVQKIEGEKNEGERKKGEQRAADWKVLDLGGGQGFGGQG